MVAAFAGCIRDSRFEIPDLTVNLPFVAAFPLKTELLKLKTHQVETRITRTLPAPVGDDVRSLNLLESG